MDSIPPSISLVWFFLTLGVIALVWLADRSNLKIAAKHSEVQARLYRAELVRAKDELKELRRELGALPLPDVDPNSPYELQETAVNELRRPKNAASDGLIQRETR